MIPPRHLNDVRRELLDAFSRCDFVEFPLTRSVVPLMEALLPNEEVPDFLGSANQYVVTEVAKKELESEFRREIYYDFLPNCIGLDIWNLENYTCSNRIFFIVSACVY